MCTYGKDSICLTFYPPEIGSNKSNKHHEFIFLLDRSGSMSGGGIDSARKALIVYLKSLPEGSKFNIVSFGSSFQNMYPDSQQYGEEIISQTVSLVEKFQADFGGTEINAPLVNILNS